MDSKIDLSRTYILIPSYEPDEKLVGLVKSLKSLGFAVILVNDGSKEEFNSIFDQVKDDVHYLEQHPNRGKGQALRYGFSYANINKEGHDFVITCDGDGQHSIEDILRLNEELYRTNATVFGVRSFKNAPKRSQNGNFMSRLCRTMITKDYISDDQCGLRGFPISLMNELITIRGDHYEYEMNVICTFQFKCFKYSELPIETIYIDDNSSSHFSPALDTFRIQRVIWMFDLCALISFLVTIIGFGAIEGIFRTNNINFPTWLIAISALTFNAFFYYGLQSIFFPTRRFGYKGLREGMFFTIKGSIAFGLFILFSYLLNMPNTLSFFIAMFLVCFLNFWIALIIYKIKQNRKKGSK